MQVMSADEGLRGGWFTGKALKVTQSEAYVMYDELLTDDGGFLSTLTQMYEVWMIVNSSGKS